MTASAVRQRLAELRRVLEQGETRITAADDLLAIKLGLQRRPPTTRLAYLVLSVVHASIPHPDDVVEFARAWQLHGGSDTLDAQLRTVGRALGPKATRHVRVTSDVLVDLTDTSQSAFTTGIQRVARETLGHWSRHGHPFVPVTWGLLTDSLEALDGARLAQSGASTVADGPRDAGEQVVLVPFEGTLVLPEIAVDAPRSSRLRTIAEFSGSRTVAIGFDCIPVTTAEAAGPGMPGAFSRYLSTLARFDLVVPISEASAVEYRGWKRMLRGAGLAGPVVAPLELPSTGVPPESTTVEETRVSLGLPSDPIVLAVGSHEPRKNHVNFLHAAELLWREGHVFTVVMVGGNSWDTQSFDRIVARLRRRGRPITTISRASDRTVWDLYRLARFSVFCSVNEGFGLPVVESLASGTPTVTSDLGSMRDLGAGHGALLADPHDVKSMAAAMRAMFDDETHATLVAATATLPRSSWDDYASALWTGVTSGAIAPVAG